MNIKHYTICNYKAEHLERLYKLENDYIKVYPESVSWTWAYGHLSQFKNGENIICVMNENDEMIAKGHVDLHEGNRENKVFVHIRTNLKYENDSEIKDIILDRLLIKAEQLKQSNPLKKWKLISGNFSTEININNYFISKGYLYNHSLVSMKCNLLDPIPNVTPVPEDIDIRYWKIETEDDEQKYFEADREVWPEAPIGVENLRDLKKVPLWTAITAFRKQEIVGSLMAWKGKGNIGYTEEIFVLPSWRKQKITSNLLKTGLEYLKKKGWRRVIYRLR